ncbi:MAG: DJ-1/PfpI family protein [candidate division WOR-3 bacterium]|nr:DJ-1/PfpI family protein [candidate division WOR-3 bacterium]
MYYLLSLTSILLALSGSGNGSVGLNPTESETVAIFVPSNLFRDDELNTTIRLLEKYEIPLLLISTETTAAQGIDGLIIKPQRLISEIKPDKFSALVLINGSGIAPYWNDSTIWQQCREFANTGRIIVAIELAPLILAKAGLLKGRQATVYPDFYSIGILKQNGARHYFADIVQDKNIITASKAEYTGKAIRKLAAILRTVKR